MTANTFEVPQLSLLTYVKLSKKNETKIHASSWKPGIMQRKVSEFAAKFGITQSFGCVDGTHIPIKCPAENSQDFCYKQYHSLGTQAVCDYGVI